MLIPTPVVTAAVQASTAVHVNTVVARIALIMMRMAAIESLQGCVRARCNLKHGKHGAEACIQVGAGRGVGTPAMSANTH
eukprot:3200475-Alexandrium_andersonii.AAC.1